MQFFFVSFKIHPFTQTETHTLASDTYTHTHTLALKEKQPCLLISGSPPPPINVRPDPLKRLQPQLLSRYPAVRHTHMTTLEVIQNMFYTIMLVRPTLSTIEVSALAILVQV